MVIEKQKALAFTTPNLEGCSSSSKRRKKRVEEEEIEEMEWALCVGQGGEVVFRLCKNEGGKMGLYRSGERVWFGHVWGGFGRESVLNLNGEVGGVL